MKKIYTYLLVICAILVGCSASKKAYKQAKEYEEAGLYVEAAEQDLKALKKDPDFKEAIVHLKKVAPKAYYELMKRAGSLEAAENWDQVVHEYERLQNLLNRSNRYGVVFKTVNIKQRHNRAKQKAAAYHYAIAENFFKNKVWNEAAYAYLKAHEYVDNYNLAFEKAIQCFLNSGNQRLAQKEFRKALSSFQNILEIAPNHPAAIRKVAETHYLLGRRLYREERFREAFEQFELSQEFVPDFRDVEKWAERAYENAVQYVGIFPFLNQTQFSVDGYFIASEIESRVSHANLKFLDLLPHPEVIGLISELRSTRHFRVSEAELLNVAKTEGMNSIVWGKIKDVDIRDEPETFTEHEHHKTVVIQDSSGNDVETREPVFYREYTKSRLVRIEIQYFILDTETGKYLDEHRFREDIQDKAHWISYQGSIYDLPKNKRKYLDAPRNVKSKFVLMNQLIEKVSKKISREVIQFYK